MDRKQLISFAFFTIPALTLAYKTVPEVILPICGLFITYITISRHEMKKKVKSSYIAVEHKTTASTGIKYKVTAQKIKNCATIRNN